MRENLPWIIPYISKKKRTFAHRLFILYIIIYSMRFRHLLPCCLFVAALASCIGDEAPNKEAAIDACTGTDVQFTNAMASSRGFNIYVNRGADLSAQYLTFTIPEGATIAAHDAATGDTPFTPNEDGSYSATLNFDNAGFNRLITVTSEDGANRATYLIQLIQMELPTEYHFERLQETNQSYHILLEEEAMTTDGLQHILQWCSGNPGFELTKEADGPLDYPTVQIENGYVGRCAKLETRATGDFGAMVGMYIAAGNLFIGSFDLSNALNAPLASTRFGVQFYHKPVRLKGYYKYKRGAEFTESGQVVEGKQDSFDIYAMLYEAEDPSFMLDGANGKTNNSIVLLASIDQAEALETNTWTEFNIPFVPMNGKTVDEQKLSEGKYKLGIVFSSSIEGNYFKGAVGSTLWIDEVELVCE